MAVKEKKRTTVTVKLTDEEKARLRLLAQERHMSMSNLIVQWIYGTELENPEKLDAVTWEEVSARNSRKEQKN